MAGEKKRSSNFLVQGSILAAAGILVRIIGLIYRIPMTNILGDEGIGVYSAAFQIYNIILLLSSYSLPMAVSKIVSARLALKEYRNSNRVFTVSMIFALIIGLAGGLLAWFGADFFAVSVLNMPEASEAIQVLAPAIFFMAVLGVLRGYFQGQGTMIPTALSQIFEQIVNAVVSVLAAYYLFQYGRRADLIYGTSAYANSYGAAGGTLGTLMGAVTALLFCAAVYCLYRGVNQKRAARDRTGRCDSYLDLTRILIITVVPVMISSVIYNVSSLVDNSIFGYYMSSAGQLDEYKSIWGAFSGKYLTLVHVPVAIATSLASSLMPTLSSAMARKDREKAVSSIDSVIRFTMLIAIPSAVGLAVLSTPVMDLLFNGNTDLAGSLMLLGSSAVVFFSLSTVTNSILHGINHMKEPVINSAIALAAHTALLAVLLWGFNLGIYGVVAANIAFGLFTCILNQISIRRSMNYRQNWRKTYLLPFAASAVMGAVVWAVYRLLMMLLHSNLLAVVISIAAGVLLYFILLLLFRAVDADDLASMPMGRTLTSFGRKLHLL